MSTRAPCVLIVDDEPLIRWALTQTLTDRGCEVLEAGDARSAVNILGNGDHQFDVVVLDYHLPDAHGLALLATTRRLSPASRVIMVTAFMAPEAAAEAWKLGAYDVISKPVDMNALASRVLGMSSPGEA